MTTSACPGCRRPLEVLTYRPFCSRRCADVDLQRWLVGAYRVEAVEDEAAGPEAAPDGGAGGKG